MFTVESTFTARGARWRRWTMKGRLVLNRKVPSRPGELLQLFDELRPRPIEVAFEATFG